jgi:hypothetical protein
VEVVIATGMTVAVWRITTSLLVVVFMVVKADWVKLATRLRDDAGLPTMVSGTMLVA